MYKITLYSDNGIWMKEWKAVSYDWSMDFRGIKMFFDDDSEVLVMGGIIVVEWKNENEKAHS